MVTRNASVVRDRAEWWLEASVIDPEGPRAREMKNMKKCGKPPTILLWPSVGPDRKSVYRR